MLRTTVRRALAGGSATLLALLLWAAPGAMAADTIYWATPYTGVKRIYFANLDGSSSAPTPVNTGTATVNTPWGLAPDPAAGKIYWANYFGNKISWAALDGSAAGDLNTGAATVNGPASNVVVDHVAGKIYWANSTGNKISWAKLDGSGGADFNTGTATVSSPVGVAIDTAAGKIYWANYDNTTGNKISFAKLDNSGGGDLNIIGTTVNSPWGVTISQTRGKIFWGNFQTNAVDFANLDGTGGGILSTPGAAQDGPMLGAIDDATGKIYWANWNSGAIVFANLNGNGGGGTLYPSPGAAATAMPVILKSPAGTGAPGITAPGTVTPTTLSCSQGAWGADLLGELVYRAPRSFAYQWTLSGAPIAGATTNSVTASSPGDYRCSVTATNAAGATTQTSAPVSVTAPPPPPPPPPPIVPPPPAPYPRITITVSGSWTVSDMGVRIVSMRVRGIPAGATVRLTCKPCHVKQTSTAKRPTMTLTKLAHKLLRRGASFSVTVIKSGAIGDQITLTVKRYGHTRKDFVKAAGKPFTTKHACVPVGSSKAAKTCAAHP